jgi:ParB family transcriptional regulator, chromosome partitioning protein
MSSIISADPFKCRLWSLHDRFSSEINEHTCKAEIESISMHGQFVPALGRRIADDPNYEIELIYGARRLFAARHLKRPLLVEVREMTDREGLIAMDIENRQRLDISPYERGLSYKRWLHTGHFESQDQISQTLKISASQVSRLLQLARLPAVVVNAFRAPAEIREDWGLKLVEALDDPQRRAATIRSARTLGSNTPRLQGRDVIRKLLSFSARGRKPKLENHDKVVPGSDGAALFRIRYLSSSIALIFAAEKMSDQSLDRIETTLSAILQGVPEPANANPKRRIDAGEITQTATLDFGPASPP